MRRILILLISTAACVGARGQHPAPEEYIYPICDVEGLYSANFGEMRPGHFHAGIDIKTDGAEGKPLVAVADGYDYYYVPTFYVDGVKVHEGGIYPDEVEAILRKAMK